MSYWSLHKLDWAYYRLIDCAFVILWCIIISRVSDVDMYKRIIVLKKNKITTFIINKSSIINMGSRHLSHIFTTFKRHTLHKQMYMNFKHHLLFQNSLNFAKPVLDSINSITIIKSSSFSSDIFWHVSPLLFPSTYFFGPLEFICH